MREAGALLQDPASPSQNRVGIKGQEGASPHPCSSGAHLKVTLPTLRGGEGTPKFG